MELIMVGDLVLCFRSVAM